MTSHQLADLEDVIRYHRTEFLAVCTAIHLIHATGWPGRTSGESFENYLDATFDLQAVAAPGRWASITGARA